MTTIRKPIAREYRRVSLDRHGTARSVTEQHADNERAASANGWELGAPYVDSSVSASRYTTKARADFERLAGDLERDRFGANVLMLWEPSRGSRKLSEWARFLELLEERGVLVHVTAHGRTYDLTNARDRRSLHEDGVDATYESDKVSDRTKRASAASLAGGRPYGRLPFGYTRSYDERTGRLVSQHINPAEAKIVRELYRRLAKGHSLRQIAADFAARRLLTRSGIVFTPQHLRDMALRPTYLGMRYHATTPARHRDLDNCELVDGTWPAIVSKSVWYAVHARLTAAERKTTVPGGAKHLLTFIAVCDACSGPLGSTLRFGAPHLQCHKRGCVLVDEADLDEYTTRVMLAYLARDDVIDELRRDGRDDDQLTRVRDALAEARSELRTLQAAVKAGRKGVATLIEAVPTLTERVESLEAQERELAAPPALAAILAPGKDVRRRWNAAPISARREVARILLGPGMLGELRVQRRPAGGNVRVPAHERVVWRRDDGDHAGE